MINSPEDQRSLLFCSVRCINQGYPSLKRQSLFKNIFLNLRRQGVKFTEGKRGKDLYLLRMFLLAFAIAAISYTLYVAVGIAREHLKSTACKLEAKRIVLITAHPDDECMFFAPVIKRLRERDIAVHLLCLSTGNYYGLGKERTNELKSSCKFLGIECTVIDEPKLQDGNGRWDAPVVSDAISEFMKGKDFDAILTFDRYGVSGHWNHCDVHTGIRYYAARSKNPYVLIELETLPLIVKYCGVLALIYEYVRRMLEGNSENRMVVLLDFSEVSWAYEAMAMHKSQLLWFRYLYLVFSSYLHINTFDIRRPIK
jgi:N-acetylglucosaminylphosphatidylinositol deacetylase